MSSFKCIYYIKLVGILQIDDEKLNERYMKILLKMKKKKKFFSLHWCIFGVGEDRRYGMHNLKNVKFSFGKFVLLKYSIIKLLEWTESIIWNVPLPMILYNCDVFSFINLSVKVESYQLNFFLIRGFIIWKVPQLFSLDFCPLMTFNIVWTLIMNVPPLNSFQYLGRLS